MDLFLIIFSAALIILGIIGSFMPVLPGPLTSWFGLFTLNLISSIEIDKTLLIIIKIYFLRRESIIKIMITYLRYITV